MDWECELISLYLFVCKHYQTELSNYCARMARFSDLKFSEEEAITLYLYGVIEGHRTILRIQWTYQIKAWQSLIAPPCNVLALLQYNIPSYQDKCLTHPCLLRIRAYISYRSLH